VIVPILLIVDLTTQSSFYTLNQLAKHNIVSWQLLKCSQ